MKGYYMIIWIPFFTSVLCSIKPICFPAKHQMHKSQDYSGDSDKVRSLTREKEKMNVTVG